MRATTSLAALSVAVLLFAICSPPSAGAATADDACALVTRAQVTAAVGVPVDAGTHINPAFVKSCTFYPTGGAREDFKFVTVSFLDVDSYEASKRLMQQTQAMVNQRMGTAKMESGSASGIGDDAFYTSMGTDYTGLMVKKGKVVLKIGIYGGIDTGKKIAAEKTLALQALSKL